MNKLVVAAIGGVGILTLGGLVAARAIIKRIVNDPEPPASGDMGEMIDKHWEDALADVVTSPLTHLKDTVASVVDNGKLFVQAVVTDVEKPEPAAH